jgi:hypothetical protein
MVAIAAISQGVSAGNALGADKFEKVAISLEQNIQDKDVEVKFDVIGSGKGLASLQVTAPDGRIVVDFKTPASKLGINRVTLESPEPPNDGKLQADFPEGRYKFAGLTPGGVTLNGEAVLSHALPEPASVIRPRPDENDVPVATLRVTWGEIKNLEAITIVIEQEETEQTLSATLPASASNFAVPDGFLMAATTYKLGIGTVAKDGNKTVTETNFKTAARQ